MDTFIGSALEYVERVKGATSEAQIRDELKNFLKTLLGKSADLRDISIEKSVRERGIFVGRVDLAVDGIVIEVKEDLRSRPLKRKALEQIEKYLSSDEYKNSPFAIITDGIRFEVYERENLKSPIDSFSFPEEENPKAVRQALYKLDTYILTQERLPLSAQRVIEVLGYNTPLFRTLHRKLGELFSSSKHLKNVSLKFAQWKNYMSFVYGSSVEEDLFLRHTYLSMVVKILALKLLNLRVEENLQEVLSGKYFERVGIENYIEEDFFSWILEEENRESALDLALLILSAIEKKFTFSDLSEEVEEDLLKELYQNIVTRAERQLLGEYYTPDWLVQEILEETLKDPKARILDPACGSGSFLFFAIKKKRELPFKDPDEKLKHILSSVVGVDINPVAVLIAKTNYLIALGELLRERKRNIRLPVYTADSLQALLGYSRQVFGNFIEISLEGQKIRLGAYESPELIDEEITALVDFALSSEKDFKRFLKRNYPHLEGKSANLSESAKVLKEIVREKGDSIWTFVLKNIYKPLFLQGKFDLVVGNPPWIVYNRMNSQLQEITDRFLKDFGIKVRGENKSHVELATLFLILSAYRYLKEGGEIVFVMPYSVLSGDQNEWLRKNNRYKDMTLEVYLLYDLKDIEPLFNQASCVVFARKEKTPKSLKKEIPAKVFLGRLPYRNANLGIAKEKLSVEEKKVLLVDGYWTYEMRQHKESIYVERFKKGAELIPRPFWFVEVEETPLGRSEESVPVVPKNLGDEKVKITGKELRGSVPERFFFKTLLSKRMYPFGWVDFDEVILPLEVEGDSYRLLDYYELVGKKKFSSASDRFRYWVENSTKLPRNFREWLVKAQEIWEHWRGEKAESANIIDWLNYRNKLTNQPVRGGYLVIYTAHGSNPCAVVVENDERFVVDHMTFYASFESYDEALFVSAFINSSVLLQKIREKQSQGLFGERHIHKLIVRQPIPEYDAGNSVHREIVEVSKEAVRKAQREEVREWLRDVHPNRIRSLGRWLLEVELNHIDRLVARLLGLSAPPPPKKEVFFTSEKDPQKAKKALKKLLKEKGIDAPIKLYPATILGIKYHQDATPYHWGGEVEVTDG